MKKRIKCYLGIHYPELRFYKTYQGFKKPLKPFLFVDVWCKCCWKHIIKQTKAPKGTFK